MHPVNRLKKRSKNTVAKHANIWMVTLPFDQLHTGVANKQLAEEQDDQRQTATIKSRPANRLCTQPASLHSVVQNKHKRTPSRPAGPPGLTAASRHAAVLHDLQPVTDGEFQCSEERNADLQSAGRLIVSYRNPPPTPSLPCHRHVTFRVAGESQCYVWRR